MTIREEVNAACEQIKSAHARLEELRAACPHPSYHVGLYSWRIAAFHLKRICVECGEVVGDPSNEERAAYDRDNPREPFTISIVTADRPD